MAMQQVLEDGDPAQVSVCVDEVTQETHICLYYERAHQDASTTHPPKISRRIRTHPDASGRIRTHPEDFPQEEAQPLADRKVRICCHISHEFPSKSCSGANIEEEGCAWTPPICNLENVAVLNSFKILNSGIRYPR